MSPQCCFKDKPKEEWFINKSQQSHVQANKKEKSNNSKSSNLTQNTKEDTKNKEHQTGWAGVHFQLYQAHKMRNWILLNNESTVTIFCNPNMVTNIQEVNEQLDLITNAGVLKTTTKVVLPGWGVAWFNPAAITNIFSYLEMAKKHQITYNSNKEDAFTVHLPEQKIKFTKTEQGLYAFKPLIKKWNNEVALVTTIEENKMFFTQRQYQRAKKARELYHALGTPLIKDFKNIITTNAIADNPINTEDIELAQQIFGEDIGSLKGKTIRRKLLPVAQDYIEIPLELTLKQKNVILCIDGIKVNRLTFLTTVSRSLSYRTAQFVIDRLVNSYSAALHEVFKIYNKAGFTSRK
jgi:hypothetical protein